MQWHNTTVVRFALASIFASTTWAAQDVVQTFTFDGRAYSDSAATSPMLDNILARIQVLNSAQDCIIYEETQSINTTATNGYFTIQIGSASGASKRSSNDPGHVMSKVFSNTAGAILGKLISNGAACSYAPTAGDKRYVRLQMTPAADNVTRTISPNMALDSVPQAMVAERAESLQGYSPSNFLQVNSVGATALSQANLESLFSVTNFSRLTTLTSVAPSNYVQTGTNGSASIPSVAGNPGSALAAGQIWYDSTNSVLKYYDGAVKTVGTTAAAGFSNGGNSFGAAANLGTNDAFGLNFKTNNASRMTVDSAGNVGIGTTAPTSLLTVNGITKIGSGIIQFGGSNYGESNRTTVGINNSASYNNSVVLGNGNVTGQGDTALLVGISNDVNHAAADGAVGFGRANIVEGSSVALGISNNTTNSANSVAVGIGIINTTPSSLQIGPSNTAKITILSSGKVGIGTTTPATSLDLSSKTDGVNMPRGTTAQQPGCTAATEGNLRYNSQNKLMEFCNGTIWQMLPAVQSASQTAPAGSGYFVLSAGTWDGQSFGGKAGADSACLTDLTNNAWKGKATAQANGQLTAAKVKSFLCDGISCNNLLPLATYAFATSGDATAGGATLVTDANGAGPNDSIVWSSANYFQSATTFWTDRPAGTATAWDFAASNDGGYCSGGGGNSWNANWNQNGAYGDTSQSGSGRWRLAIGWCNIARHFICIVNP